MDKDFMHGSAIELCRSFSIAYHFSKINIKNKKTTAALVKAAAVLLCIRACVRRTAVDARTVRSHYLEQLQQPRRRKP